MLSAIAAGITLLSTIIGLWAWWIKRKRAPTIEERKADNRQNFQDTFRNVYELRNQGNQEEADAMLRRIATSATSNLMRNIAESSLNKADPNRQFLGDNTPEGKHGVDIRKDDSSTEGNSRQ